ncbi:MAG: CoA-binding protein [Candidatus Hydrogenedentes bacterium]|nr:CoA-binding protein [Candidatus Hydrogenedentota bacterium]
MLHTESEAPAPRTPIVVVPNQFDIAAKHPGELFFNPGSEDAEVMDLARAKGINVVNACSIVNIGLRPEMYPDE